MRSRTSSESSKCRSRGRAPKSNCERFNCNKFNVLYWCWNYRSWWQRLPACWSLVRPHNVAADSMAGLSTSGLAQPWDEKDRLLGAARGGAATPLRRICSRLYRWPDRPRPNRCRRHRCARGGGVARQLQWPLHHSPALVRGHSTSGIHGFIGAGSGSAVGRGGDNDSGTGGGEGRVTGSGRGDIAADGMVVTDATVDAVNLTATHHDRGPSRICPRIGLVAAALPPRKPGRTRRLHRSCAPIATSRTTSCE